VLKEPDFFNTPSESEAGIPQILENLRFLPFQTMLFADKPAKTTQSRGE
jgi:hypothetical protein